MSTKRGERAASDQGALSRSPLTASGVRVRKQGTAEDMAGSEYTRDRLRFGFKRSYDSYSRMNQAFESNPEHEACTKDRILDAAERLFGEQGFDATSLRQITAEARVNLGAVNYHFQSKELLMRAVIGRRIGAVNRERYRRLDEMEAVGGPKTVEEVIEAFIVPVMAIKAAPLNHPFRKLIGRLYAEPDGWLMKEFRREMAPAVERFDRAIRAVLPGAPKAELVCGMTFGIGSLAHFMAGRELMKQVSAGLVDPDDLGLAAERLVVFISAGMRALSEYGQRKETGHEK